MSTRWYIHGLCIALFFGAAFDIKAEPVEEFSQIKKDLTAQCVAQLPQIFNEKAFSPVFTQHPVDVNSICSCAVAVTSMDSRVRRRIDTAPSPSNKQTALAQLQGFVAARFMSAMFSCAVPEINAALESNEQRMPLSSDVRTPEVAEKTALANHLIDLLQYRRLASDMNQICGETESMAFNARKQYDANPKAFGGISPDSKYWSEVLDAFSRYRAKLCLAGTDGLMANYYAREFEKKLSEEELETLVGFYSSPVGRHFASTGIDVLPGYMTLLKSKTTEIVNAAYSETQLELEEVLARYRRDPH